MHTWKSTGNIRLSRLFKISANRGGEGRWWSCKGNKVRICYLHLTSNFRKSNMSGRAPGR